VLARKLSPLSELRGIDDATTHRAQGYLTRPRC
jgi:hypothetical protein